MVYFSRAKLIFVAMALASFSGCATTSDRDEGSAAEVAGERVEQTEDEHFAQQAKAINDQNPNRVSCKPYRPTGSRISKRLCLAQHEWDRLRKEGQELSEKAQPVPVQAPIE